ncbi:MAG: methyltransferase family protein [Candidatus Thorarchaeota archaeon]|jgi:protein-S-isoprenylcysteine O-methyltransferase Ste14
MIDRTILVIGILGAWVVSALINRILKWKRADNLPSGSVVLEFQDDEKVREVPSPSWAKFGVSLAMGGNILIQIVFLILLILNLWDEVIIYIGFSIPTWLVWVGLIGIWFHLALGISVMYYNVNYTPLYKAITKTYVLATGGPYSVVRHPQYLSYAILTPFVFLITGTWLIGITALGWLALPRQISGEENLLSSRFGETYLDYCSKVGRLIPRIRKQRTDRGLRR